jgi:hypothetical protein
VVAREFVPDGRGGVQRRLVFDDVVFGHVQPGEDAGVTGDAVDARRPGLLEDGGVGSFGESGQSRGRLVVVAVEATVARADAVEHDEQHVRTGHQ